MRDLLILYGSETGTAQEAAQRLSRDAFRYHYQCSIWPMNDFDVRSLSNINLAIFIAATTGQGENPANMKIFFENLWKLRNNSDKLKGLKYGVLGLGDSSYQKFNFAAKRLNKLLEKLGASSVINIGLADDQHDLGADFVIDKWFAELWTKLDNHFPLPEDLKPLPKTYLHPSKFRVRYLNERLEDTKILVERPRPHNYKEIKHATLNANVKMTPKDHFQDVRLIDFVHPDWTEETHKPGDVIHLQPQNLDEHVEEFLKVLNLDGNKTFYLEPRKYSLDNLTLYFLPQPCTLRQCVKSFLNIWSVPNRYFFELMYHFTTDETEKEKFLEFTTAEGQQDLFDYCHRPRRSILEVMADFPHIVDNIPIEYLFDLIPPIQARPYSIASSSVVMPGKVQILVAVVEFQTILKRTRKGLCSTWLSRLEPGTSVPVWFSKGSFSFPDPRGHCPPVVLISTGTGCAPFRPYIQERVALSNTRDLVVIFGCRSKHKDNFFWYRVAEIVRRRKAAFFGSFFERSR